ncbi:hypothetical protein TI05_03600 [Achromatium sp. WMS3]|nr:hypothetical protein TI05_03600 [Achromatium sp. WMS3]
MIGILTALTGFVAWRFQITDPLQVLKLCEQMFGTRPKCEAPVPDTNVWQYCVGKLTAKTLDPIVFRTKMLRRSLLNTNPVTYGEPQLVSSGSTLYGYDKLQVSLTPPTVVRVYLLYKDANGNFTAFLTDQHLKAEQEYLLPTSGIQLANVQSDDKFYVLLATDESHPMLDYQIRVLEDAALGPAASKRLAALLDGPLAGHYLLFNYQTQPWVAPAN